MPVREAFRVTDFNFIVIHANVLFARQGLFMPTVSTEPFPASSMFVRELTGASIAAVEIEEIVRTRIGHVTAKIDYK